MRYEFCLSIGEATLERQIRERLKTDNLKVGTIQSPPKAILCFLSFCPKKGSARHGMSDKAE